MPNLVTNGCRLHYQVSGSGPAIVFLHGENHGMPMFDAQMAYFGERFRCVSYDRRGHGRSEAPPYGYSLHSQTLDLAGLLDVLEIREAVLVAVAMSTPIAVTYALNNPERVMGLVLVSWYELDGYPTVEERRKAFHPIPFVELNMRLHDVQQRGGKPAVADFILREVDTLFPIFPPDTGMRKRLAELFADQPEDRYLHAAEYYTSLPNLIPEMRRLVCPVLGICGTADPSPDDPRLLLGLASFRQAWIEGARRFSLLESADAFNTILQDFLLEISPVSAAR